jgi:hypothetical protein
MKALLSSILLLFQTFTSHANEAPLSIIGKDGKTIPPEVANVYLLGATQGIVIANVYLLSKEMSPLFCMPMEISISPEKLYELAKTKLMRPHESSIIIIAAIDSLVEKYPCPTKK